MIFQELDTAMRKHIECVERQYQVFTDWMKAQGYSLDEELNVEEIKRLPDGCMLLMVIVMEDLIYNEREEKAKYDEI
jgi:hypothetical protein